MGSVLSAVPPGREHHCSAGGCVCLSTDGDPTSAATPTLGVQTPGGQEISRGQVLVGARNDRATKSTTKQWHRVVRRYQTRSGISKRRGTSVRLRSRFRRSCSDRAATKSNPTAGHAARPNLPLLGGGSLLRCFGYPDGHGLVVALGGEPMSLSLPRTCPFSSCR